MPNSFLVYLSGPITGLTYTGATEWREYTAQAFPPHITAVTPMRAKRYLDLDGSAMENDGFAFPLSTDRATNVRNRFDTLRADVVLVNLLGATRVSIGAVMEIAWAYDHNIPVIVAMEPEGNIHDFSMIRDSTSVRVASLDEAIEAVVAMVSPEERFIWTRIEQVKLLREEGRLNLQPQSSKENYFGGPGRSR